MINGSIVDLITPICKDGSPDYDVLETLVEWHIENNSAALLIGSATAQSTEFDIDERGELLKRAIWQSDGRIPIIADLSAGNPEQVFDYARTADEFGSGAMLLTLASHNFSTQEELIEYLRELCALVELPLILRDDFSNANILSPKTLIKLSQIEGLLGFVNNSSQVTSESTIHVHDLPANFALYAGHDSNACQLSLSGYRGGISIVANLAPSLVQNMFTAALIGDQENAEVIDKNIQEIAEGLMEDPNSIPVMWALVEMGCIPEREIPPSLPQSSDYANLRRALRSAQIPI
jgi:4-hydroxy-tetrahydrodipicolinate synthase